MKVLAENIDLASIHTQTLTNDCKFVRRVTGEVDLVRCHKSVHIFDYYWDRGIKILKIWHAGGIRNPRVQEPEW
jgi:hypothetical protein